jgi:aryl-alcohol dehydrogenase-like predicted oxidoreductase/histidinol phosphatase-like enzyme/predicted kinase
MSALLPGGALPIGLGTMRLQGEEAVPLIHRALDAGIRLLDTADVYGTVPGANERLVARALSSWSGDQRSVLLATKGGLCRRGRQWLPDGRAKHIREACEASLEALGVDAIELYQLHAPDPRVPFTTTLRALAALVREGMVRRVGLSNVSLEELESGQGILEISSVQVSLSWLDTTVLKNGVFEHCIHSGITLLAHSPLGGHRMRGRLAKDQTLAGICARRAASVEEVALAWLRSLHPLVIALTGSTRFESLESSLRAASLDLVSEDVEEIERARPEARAVRIPREERAPRPAADGEVLIFVGLPGSGKSTLAETWVSQGYRRLNRDLEGGSLASLLPELDQRLAAGERRFVLDNTYARREARFDVIEVAWRHGVPVRCLVLDTSLEDAQWNAAERMVARYGRLLSPEEMKKAAKRDPNSFPPEAQFRFRRQLEPPRVEEGFSSIEVVSFTRSRRREGGRRALFLEADGVLRRSRRGAPRPLDPDDVEVVPGRGEALMRYRDDGYLLLGVSYQPEIGEGRTSEEEVRATFERTNELLGLHIDFRFCPHEGGPPVCWCRKPLPGLGVVLIREHEVDPASSLVVVGSAADQGFADRLRVRAISADDFFGLPAGSA